MYGWQASFVERERSRVKLRRAEETQVGAMQEGRKEGKQSIRVYQSNPIQSNQTTDSTQVM
eukprot:scaffold1221_cov207-Amphora_coffeaeformis.AAC.12